MMIHAEYIDGKNILNIFFENKKIIITQNLQKQ